MEKKNKSIIAGLVILAIICIYMLCLCYMSKVELTNSICTNDVEYYLLALLLCIFLYNVIKNSKIFYIYIFIMFCLFAIFSIADKHYSPVDEIPNYDYINYIIDNKKLPTFDDNANIQYINEANNQADDIMYYENYEAVQAPLYYILFAMFGKIIKSSFYRFHIFRLISLLSVLIIYYFLNKSIDLLHKHDLCTNNEDIMRIGLLLTIFNPAYLYRASRLNNEILVCVIMAILIYISLKCILDDYKTKYYWIMAFLCISLFMTKNTAIYAYVVLVFIAVYQRKYVRQAVLAILCSGALAIPWFAFNYKHYNSLTAMKEHLAYVLPIVNPQNHKVDLFDAIVTRLPNTYFSGEEIAFSQSDMIFIGYMYICAVIMLIYITQNILMEIKNKKSIENISKVNIVNVLSMLLLIGCFMCLTVGTISTRICSIRGRYFYGPCIILCIILVLNKRWLNTKMIICTCIVLSLVTTRTIVTYFNRIYTNENVFGSKVKSVNVDNYNDAEWENGFSKDSKKFILKKENNKDIEDYRLLIGREILGQQKATYVTDVAENKSKGYVYVQTNREMSQEMSEGAIRLGDNYVSESYNVGSLDNTLENIEGGNIAQSVKVKKTGKIAGCQLLVGTYAQSKYKANIKYTISTQSDGKVISEGNVIVEDIGDNSYMTVYFDTPISAQKNELLLFAFEISNDQDLPITVYTSLENKYVDGSAYVNQIEAMEQDMKLKIIHN